MPAGAIPIHAHGACAMTDLPKIALLLETSTEFGRGLLRGIVRYAELNGPWSIFISSGHFEQELPKAKSWHGTVILVRVHTAAITKAIRATGLPAVTSSSEDVTSKKEPGDNCEIRTDSPGIARMGARHLLEQGLKNFAFCGFRAVPWSFAREKVFRHFLTERGYGCRTRRISMANWTESPDGIGAWEREQPDLAAWLTSLPKPVGVMACNDICGRNVLQACATAGLRAPDDVAVVGVDNDELSCGLSTPPLSSVALNLDHAGYEAAAALDALMSGRAPRQRVIAVEPTVVVARRSTETVAADDPALAAALRFIRDSTGRPISVPDVVREARVSRRTLERCFADTLGHSVLAEITNRRLERAKRLLQETDLPVHLVSAHSGFNSVKTFFRSFQMIEGKSAMEFRKRSVAERLQRRRRNGRKLAT